MSHVDSNKSPIRTRRRTEKQERRNSVSDIADYFNRQDKMTGTSTCKTSGRSQKDKEKDKEKEKELREVRENIKAMIDNDNNKDTDQRPLNANGDNAKHDNEIASKQVESNTISETSIIKETGAISIATQTNDDEILKALRELAEKYNKVETDLNDPKNGVSVQLAKTQQKVTSLYTDIHGAVSGLEVRMQQITATANSNLEKIIQIQNWQKRMTSLLDENKRLVSELQVMQGLVQKVTNKAESNSQQVMDLTKRGMEQNLIIHGIDDTIEIEDPKLETPEYANAKERCKYAALLFFRDTMKLNLDIEDIWKAHRLGPFKQNKVRPMIVKLAYNAKDLVLENMHRLKGLKNQNTQQSYFINEQIPEGCTELKKQMSARLKTLKEKNDAKPRDQRSVIQAVGSNILVDGELDKSEVSTPQPSQLFLDAESQAQIDEIQTLLVETQPEVVKNSQFIGLAIHATDTAQVQRAYIAVAQRYPSSDHIMLGYALKEKGQLKAGSCDDKEYGAGAKIRNLIFQKKARDVAVFVLRKYGGIHLGFNRFAAIESVASKAIELLGEHF